MAAYRKISITFWADSFIQSLTPEGKYFYLYLMTNTRTTQCGIYEITINQICFETGYNQETVLKLLQQLERTGRVKYSKSTNEIALKNWPKYNDSNSPKVRACVESELKNVKNRVLIQYLYSMDTLSQETKEEEETKEESKTETKAARLLDLPFTSDAFYNTWIEWEEYRKQLKKKLTPASAKRQIKFLAGRREIDAILIIEQSITNGWTGLFELNNGKQQTRTFAESVDRISQLVDQQYPKGATG